MSDTNLTCPAPVADPTLVTMAHGGGGRLMHQLIERVFMDVFKNDYLDRRHDGAVLPNPGAAIAMTTDSYVVRPLFFPGGDIGSLAVNGTVNDLAMCGARPAWLSAGFIIEEGFAIEDLRRIAGSMRRAADEAGVAIVTGDTKVIERARGDGVYINTAGVGFTLTADPVEPAAVRPGDAVIVSGDIGRHGIAIMARREGLEFDTPIESDCAALNGLVETLIRNRVAIHCLRDLTRGGLAAALVEIAQASALHIEIDEPAVPVREPVRGACELLGLDPLHVANEGRMVAFVAPEHAGETLRLMRANPLGIDSAIIGVVAESGTGRVILRGMLGGRRILDLPTGEQLPRIC
ncbi:hydrogenase expression/formation protein HypE [bacterium]|nr:hydrogenase expression/formation protein HypE [bacterium]